MIKDITIGQYFPGESFVHKMDPRMKILLTIVYVVALFIVNNLLGFLIIGALMAAIIISSKISYKIIFKSIKPLLFIIIFTGIFNIFYGSGPTLFENVKWLSWLTLDGILNALFIIIRIVLLILGTSFMTYTTSPVLLTDAMERLLKPLKLIKVPVHEMAMMMTIALRFIPTLIDETEKIMNAQKARGALLDSGTLTQRVKALVPVLIPLFISAFRRADELATAMECRCYHGGEGRTRLKTLRLTAKDWLLSAVCVAVLCCIACSGALWARFWG